MFQQFRFETANDWSQTQGFTKDTKWTQFGVGGEYGITILCPQFVTKGEKLYQNGILVGGFNPFEKY